MKRKGNLKEKMKMSIEEGGKLITEYYEEIKELIKKKREKIDKLENELHILILKEKEIRVTMRKLKITFEQLELFDIDNYNKKNKDNIVSIIPPKGGTGEISK